jgi:hypothetical protein
MITNKASYYIFIRRKNMQLLADWVRNGKSHWPKIQSGTCRNGLASLRIWILLLIRMQSGLQRKKLIQIATVNPHHYHRHHQMPFFVNF